VGIAMQRYKITDLVTYERFIATAHSKEHALEQARKLGFKMTFYTIEQSTPAKNRWNENRGIS